MAVAQHVTSAEPRRSPAGSEADRRLGRSVLIGLAVLGVIALVAPVPHLPERGARDAAAAPCPHRPRGARLRRGPRPALRHARARAGAARLPTSGGPPGREPPARARAPRVHAPQLALLLARCCSSTGPALPVWSEPRGVLPPTSRANDRWFQRLLPDQPARRGCARARQPELRRRGAGVARRSDLRRGGGPGGRRQARAPRRTRHDRGLGAGGLQRLRGRAPPGHASGLDLRRRLPRAAGGPPPPRPRRDHRPVGHPGVRRRHPGGRHRAPPAPRRRGDADAGPGPLALLLADAAGAGRAGGDHPALQLVPPPDATCATASWTRCWRSRRRWPRSGRPPRSSPTR